MTSGKEEEAMDTDIAVGKIDDDREGEMAFHTG